MRRTLSREALFRSQLDCPRSLLRSQLDCPRSRLRPQLDCPRSLLRSQLDCPRSLLRSRLESLIYARGELPSSMPGVDSPSFILKVDSPSFVLGVDSPPSTFEWCRPVASTRKSSQPLHPAQVISATLAPACAAPGPRSGRPAGSSRRMPASAAAGRRARLRCRVAVTPKSARRSRERWVIQPAACSSRRASSMPNQFNRQAIQRVAPLGLSRASTRHSGRRGPRA